MQLKLRLSSIKKNDVSMDVYYNEIKKHAATLAAIGEPLRLSDHTAFLLSGLDASYNPLVMSIQTRIDPVSLEELYELLMSHEQLLTTQVEIPMANTVTRQSPTFRQQQHQQFTSFYRDQPPFRLSNRNNYRSGRGRGRARNNGYANTPHPVYCKLCRETGHTVLSCPHRFDHAFQGTPTSLNAYTAMVPSNGFDTWYHDSGATHHITSELQNLNLSASPYHGNDHLHVRDGTGLQIQNTGDTKLSLLRRNHGESTTPRTM